MALPVTISGVNMANQNYFHGPFIDGNGNVYVPIPDTTENDPSMFRATDPTDSFTEQDSAGKPAFDGLNSFWVFQNGDTFHIVTYRLTTSIQYHTFTTSDHGSTPDEWVITDEEIEAPTDVSASGGVSCSIVARSDGTIVVIYNGDEDSSMGNPYARVDYNIRSSGGTWGGPVTLVADEKAAVDWFGSVAVLGASNKTHFFFKDDTNSTGKHRSLTSGDSLGSLEDVDTSIRSEVHVFGPGIFFDDGGTERIRVPYLDTVTTRRISLVQIDADDGSPALVAGIADNPSGAANGSPIACLAVDGTTGHLLYADTTDFDLYHDQADTPQDSGDWGTDTELLDAVTINRVSYNIYTRSGDVVGAYVYDDGGTIKYNEHIITAGGDGVAIPIAMHHRSKNIVVS